MYNSQYQEDINASPFFKALKRSKLYANVERNCWLVCVPQLSSITGLKITQDILDVHVLQPSPYFQGEYITANNKTVTVEDGSITIASDLREHRTAKILFEESFYTKDSKSFRVLCIDSPLAGELKTNTASAVQLPSTRSLADITTFLQSFPINSIVLSKVHEQIDELGQTYVLVKGFEDHAVGKAKALSTKALEDLVCANPDFRHLYDDDHLNNELSLVVESYVVGALYPFLYPSLKSIFVQEDARIRDNILSWRSRNLAKEIELKPDLVPHVAHITPHLQRLESCHTPLEKLWCVQEGLDAAAFAVSISRAGDTLGADDSLPLLLAAIIQANPPNLHTTLYYIQNFIFGNISASQLGYHLTNFQAAIHFIRGEEEESANGADTAQENANNHSTPPPVSSLSPPTASSFSSIPPLAVNHNRYIGDEILDYLTSGVPDSTVFTPPHRYTSSTPRSASTMNVKENANNSNNNNSTYNSNYSTNYRPSKAYTSATNPLMSDKQDWQGANQYRSRSEMDLGPKPPPPLLHSQSYTAPSAFSMHAPNANDPYGYNPRQPQPQQYKRPPSVIKLETNNEESEGGFLAQLRKLNDDGVSSSQLSSRGRYY